MLEEFSAKRYKKMHGFHTPWLVILSNREKKANAVPVSCDPLKCKTLVYKTIPTSWWKKFLWIMMSLWWQDESLKGVAARSTLIGSSHECRVFVQKIGCEFETSLASDQGKDQQRKAEKAFAQNERRKELRIAIESQTPQSLKWKTQASLSVYNIPNFYQYRGHFVSLQDDRHVQLGRIFGYLARTFLARTNLSPFIPVSWWRCFFRTFISTLYGFTGRFSPYVSKRMAIRGNKAEVQLVQSEKDIATLCDLLKLKFHLW